MLQTTPSSRPAFQPKPIEDRIRELRKIAKPIVQHYLSDVDKDEELLRNHPEIRTWLWVPYPNGSHISSFTPRHKSWATAILETCQTSYAKIPTPYLITKNGLRRTTWADVRDRIQQLPNPTYQVKNAEGDVLTTTRDWHRALRTYEYHQGGATLHETSEPKPLLQRDTAPAQRA